MTQEEKDRFWDAVEKYIHKAMNVRSLKHKQEALAQAFEVEKIVDDIAAGAVRRTLDEALNSGDGSYRP